MFRVDKALFSNVVTTVQRTANLPGGAIRNLPGGASLEGIKGVESFAAEVADAKKEFELGRVHNAVSRARQLEMQFNSIVGRWNAQAGAIIASARQGKQGLPLQKLNEVKNAQAKMRQITAPAIKSFRDLITALDHAVASHGDAVQTSDVEGKTTDENKAATVATERTSAAVETEAETEAETPSEEPNKTPASKQEVHDVALPNLDRLGKFADKYRFGSKLELKLGANQKRHISPKLEEGRFYFVQGFDPPTVIRVREIHSQSVLVFDAFNGNESLLKASHLKALLSKGMWLLMPWSKTST